MSEKLPGYERPELFDAGRAAVLTLGRLDGFYNDACRCVFNPSDDANLCGEEIEIRV